VKGDIQSSHTHKGGGTGRARGL